jgi:flavodoxin
MKKLFALILAWAMLVALASCGTNAGHPDSTESGSLNEAGSQDGQGSHEETTPPSEAVPPVNANILIAYFSRVGNTDFPEDVDAVSSASLLRKDGELYGNTQYIATLIQQQIGGDLFLIQTEEKYPADYDATDRQGQQESRGRSRPALASHVENMDAYDLVFLGFPNWYYDMPMAVYTFLEEYDLAGKTIILFATSGGSGFSNAITEIQNLQPDAEILTDGYKVSHSKAADVTSADIEEWINGLQISG